jgi:hypothetical protein
MQQDSTTTSQNKKKNVMCNFSLLLWATIFWSNLKMPITSIEANDLNNVWEIQTWGKEHDEDDRKLLEMAANQVHPIIMCKHNQNVKLLLWYKKYIYFPSSLQFPSPSPSHPPFLSFLHLCLVVICFRQK